MDSIALNNTQKSQCFSHKEDLQAFDKVADQIIQRGDLPYITVQEQLQILEELKTFPFGRFLIENKGLNGEWTQYVLWHPERGRLTGLNSAGEPFGKLESFMLDKAPVCLATQERFQIFRQEIQKRVSNEDFLFASVPSGLMDALLSVDYSQASHYTLVGVDIDGESIENIDKSVSADPSFAKHVQLLQQDAWKFELPKPANLIVSNGLTIYVQEDQKVAELYQHFFDQLKPGGELIASYLTPPPQLDPNSEWKVDQMNPQDLIYQKIVMSDIIDVSWQCFRSTEKTVEILKKAGFVDFEILEDNNRLFPTVIAKKPKN